MPDLTIRGAGIFGLSIAWMALERGAKVLVIDPAGPGAGASGGLVGALQPHTPDPWNAKKALQFDSLSMAEGFWTAVEQCSGQPTGYARVGRLQPLSTDREVTLARARQEKAAENWGPAYDWQITEADGLWCSPSPTGLYLRDTLSAILNPRLATLSLAKAVEAKGGKIATDAPAQGPTVWASGWQGLTELSHHFGKPVGNGVKGQAALLDHNAAGQPQIFADGLHIIPHLNGTVAIGSTTERDAANPTRTDDQLDRLIEKARDILPALGNAPLLEKWAGMRPRTKTRAPLLGPWPGRNGHFIANGGFKIGFGMAPKCAELLVDLVLTGKNAIPEEFQTGWLGEP